MPRFPPTSANSEYRVTMYVAAALLVLTVLVLNWRRMRTWESGRYRRELVVLLPIAVIALLYLQLSEIDLRDGDEPVLVVIAADVSLSMGAMPAPQANAEAGTRLDRARVALLPLLTELDASTRPVMLGVTAFTSKSETILAWEDDLPQVREVVQYVLTTGLLTEPGSDLGVALQGVEPMFGILPPAYRGAGHAKFLILVSDGEQNVDTADSATAMANLRDMGVRIISLHVGMTDTPEGLPVYDDDGKFIGFDEVGGQIFSVPDPQTMNILAGRDPSQGIFVKAEGSDATKTMMEFIGVEIAGSANGMLREGLMLILWCLSVVVMLYYS